MNSIENILLISGKRKCGKDYISEQLLNRLGKDVSQIIRISEPIKTEWAKKLNLDLKELLSDGLYKEKYRKEMIEWSDQVRTVDSGFFCREAIKTCNRKIIIVSDIRRQTDITFFRKAFGDRVRTIRISSSLQVRTNRGWQYQSGVDDVQSECDLDNYDSWDLTVVNDENGNDILKNIIDAFPFLQNTLLNESEDL